MKIRYGSICSGIEAATVAWHPLGWQPIFFAEIEAFPSAVLQSHWPEIPNLGDMTRIDGATWRGKIDLLVGGTPCQAFSVAGKRESLSDDRGNLTLKFVELVHAIDPRFVVWENVPGVLSTEDNAFGCFLAGLVGGTEPIIPRTSSGGWSRSGLVCGPRRAAAWRILDAQYVAVAGDSAVPQRRERVFVVSRHFGDLGRLETSSPERNANRVCGLLAQILFEPESLPRDSAPSREAGPSVAALTANGVGTCGANDNQGQAGHLLAVGGVAHALRAEGFDASEDGTGWGTPIIPFTNRGIHTDEVVETARANSHGALPMVAYTIHGSEAAKEATATIVSHALRAKNPFASENSTSTVIAFAQNQRDELRELDVAGALAGEPGMKQQTYLAFTCKDHGQDAGGLSPTLRSMSHRDSTPNGGGQVAIAFQERGRPDGRNLEYKADGTAYALTSPNGGGRRNEMNIATDMAVRRLTPIECARLQGFPDDHCRIPWRNKPADQCPDGPQYRAYGNSMCTKVMRWIGTRIDMVEAEATPTPPRTTHIPASGQAEDRGVAGRRTRERCGQGHWRAFLKPPSKRM